MDDTKKIPSLTSIETEEKSPHLPTDLTPEQRASNRKVIDYLCSRIENNATA